MANYNPLTTPRTNLNRNAFDLSQRHLHSQKVGQLIPVMTVETVPGDHFEIDMAHLCKTTPLNTDAFARMRLNMEAFFVPYEQLWHHWPTFLSQRNVDKTAYYRKTVSTPCFSLGGFLTECRSAQIDGRLDFMGVPMFENALRLADMLGYGSYQSIFPDVTSSIASITDVSQSYLNVFRIAAYNKIWYDYYRNKFYDTDSRLVNSFNFDDVGVYDTQNPSFTDSIVTNTGYAHALLPFATGTSFDTHWINPEAMFVMRYRQWKKDLFTSALPSQQFGLVESVGLGTFKLNGVTPANTTNPQLRAFGSSSSVGYEVDGVKRYSFSSDAAITVYQLKKAEAMQKWKETVLRAGEDFRSQMEARYGVRPKYSSLDSVDFLGSYSSEVEINPIYATAESANVPLGEIAGRAQAAGQGHISYTAQDFGVIMVICSILPESEYPSTGIDKQNTLSDPFDYFTPEVEDLGLEPVFHYQYDAIGQTQIANDILSFGTTNNLTLGYTSRYSMYKTAVDKVHGHFFENLQTFDYPRINSGTLYHWAIPRTDLVGRLHTIPFSGLYINPLIDRPIFRYTEASEDSDHFIINSFFSVHAVRPMSVLGLPQW